MTVKPAIEQFELTDLGVYHVPTGAEFVPHPGSTTSGTFRMGRLADTLPNGDDFRPGEVENFMRRLWAEHVKQRDSRR